MARARLSLVVILFICAGLATQLHPWPLAGVIIAGAAVHLSIGHGYRKTMLAALPVIVFAMATLVLQWLNGTVNATLPLRTLAVFLLTTAAIRVMPWRWIAGRLSPESSTYTLVLFLLFIRHFSEILVDESRRILQARSLCAGSTFSRSGFWSLNWAVVALFRRAITRAERFYAAQAMSGISE